MELYPRGLAGFKRYRELMALEPDVAEQPGAQEAPAFRGDITIENVSFSYDPAMPVLEDISISVKAGETIAIIGQSGAGKSTLVSLVPRFYDPQGGRILIDGVDIREFTLTSLRRQIGVVSQDVFLFGGTLRENVAYGRLGASEEEILEALAQAQLSELVATLPQGLDTVVGERGVALSGGQKQRVAIARTFLKDPPILILDEATSALDLETEKRIQKALNRLSEGRTSLVIAHRPQTISDADRVLRVEGGQLVAA